MSTRAALLFVGLAGIGALLWSRRARAYVPLDNSRVAPVLSPTPYNGFSLPDTTYTPPDASTDAPADTAGGNWQNWILNLGGSGGGSAQKVSYGNGGARDVNNFREPPAEYADLFAAAEARYGIPDRILTHMGWVESGYDINARSVAGALGIMQIVPRFHPDISLADIMTPATAINYAGNFLAQLYSNFKEWDVAVGAYNCGQGNMQKAIDGVQQLPAETIAYVRRVTGGDVVATIGSGVYV